MKLNEFIIKLQELEKRYPGTEVTILSQNPDPEMREDLDVEKISVQTAKVLVRGRVQYIKSSVIRLESI